MEELVFDNLIEAAEYFARDFVRSENRRATICGCRTCLDEANDRVDWMLKQGAHKNDTTEQEELLGAIIIRHYKNCVPPETDVNINNWRIGGRSRNSDDEEGQVYA